MHYWIKKSPAERMARIDRALQENVNFYTDVSLGYPASHLDSRVFPENASFVKEDPTLKSFVANPNHIGCHTQGTSEYAFQGTQKIEREVLDMLAVDVFKAEPESFDGYISPGGTEANIMALWVYRNIFRREMGAKMEEIAILSSEDTHYSIAKGANLLNLDWLAVPVNQYSRRVEKETLRHELETAVKSGKRYFIVVANMGTTMFGSVDVPATFTDLLDEMSLPYRLHIDAAYGGFVYPFGVNWIFGEPEVPEAAQLHFGNSKVSSISVDAHKMLQSPYGTGIILFRKGLIDYAMTEEAGYIEGKDVTLCGSRSGTNAVAIWMIMTTYGPYGWFEKIKVIDMRTNWFCKALEDRNVKFFREPFMNIVTIRAEHISKKLAETFQLVPQHHDDSNQWYKIVLMDHVEIEHIKTFLEAFDQEQRKMKVSFTESFSAN